jgi:CBS domain-containing protein
MRVAEVMSEPVYTIGPDQTVEEATGLMKLHDIEHLAVLEKKTAVGILSLKDCAGVASNVPVREVMTPRPVTIEFDEPISKAANLMRGRGIHSLLVMKNGKLAGIVTTSDLLEAIGKNAGHPERPILRDRGAGRRKVSPGPV